MPYTIKPDLVRKHAYWNVPSPGPNGQRVRRYVYRDLFKHATPNGHEWTIQAKGEWAEGEEPRLVFSCDGLYEYAKEGPDHLACGWNVADGERTPSMWFDAVHGDYDAYIAALDAAHPAGSPVAEVRDTSIEAMIHRADPVLAKRAQIEDEEWRREYDDSNQ